MHILLSFIFAITALFGPTAQPSQPAPFTLPPALTVTAQCEEDMPCWDCHTMGNHSCNVTTEATKTEAMATYKTYAFKHSRYLVDAYVGTLDHEPAHLPMTEFALQSNAQPSLWHIFKATSVTPVSLPTQPTASQPTITTASQPATQPSPQPTEQASQPATQPSTGPTTAQPSTQPSETTQPNTEQATGPTASAATWDCDTSGRTLCTGTDDGIADAWESWDASGLPIDENNPLAYTSTADTQPTARRGTVVLASINLPHTWHVFTYKNS